jgi:dethiobiotin synthetase
MANYFISAIDTDAGKSVATGLLARYLLKQGKSVATFKPAQTGCTGIAEDILTHRKLAGMELLPEDQNGESCPYVFPVPASPHLAAELAGAKIDAEVLDTNLANLSRKYEYVLVEGAGGLMVPLNRNLLYIDWAAKHNLPLILVTSARLGSINHTLLSLEAAKSRGIKVVGIIYNLFPPGEPHITTDSLQIISSYSSAPVIEIPEIIGYDIPEIDFSRIFGDTL